MLTAVIILSWLLLTSLILIIIFGIEDRFKADDWVAAALFIFAFPVYVVVRISLSIKRAVDEKKRRKKLEQLQEK